MKLKAVSILNRLNVVTQILPFIVFFACKIGDFKLVAGLVNLQKKFYSIIQLSIENWKL